jgi:hypothetical protein
VKRELRAIMAIVKKDITVWIRQPTAVAATLLPAMVLIGVLYVGAASVGRNPVALVVEDDGPHAQALRSILQDSDAFSVTELTADDAAAALRSLRVAAVITIPASFDRAFDAHQAAPVQIQINNLNLDFTNDLRRSLPAAITEFYADQPNGANPIAVDVEETDRFVQHHGVTLSPGFCGGPTGIESEAEFVESYAQLQVTLATRVEVLPQFPGKPRDYVLERLQRMNVQIRTHTAVAKVTSDAVITQSGETIQA